MENLVLLIYLIGTIGTIKIAFSVISCALFFWAGIWLLLWAFYGTENVKEMAKISKQNFIRTIYWAILPVTLFILTPSQNLFTAMIGAKATILIAENPEVKKLASKTLEAVNLKLDDVISELKSSDVNK